MKPGGLRIETIRAKDLESFFSDYVAKAAGQQISPISQYRAISQSKNPYADDSDVGLLVAYSGELCVGYQGVLPGILRTPRGDHKVYWCTAAYVLPEFRKRMVAIQLIKKLVALKQDIVLTGFEKIVGDVFKGLHFREIGPLEYISVRPDRLDFAAFPFRRFYRLQKRLPALRKISESALKLTKRTSYPVIRDAFYKSLSSQADKAIHGVKWRELSKVSSVCLNGSGASERGASFPRGAEAINWMLDYPWIREGPPPTQPAYYFSETYDQFQYIVLDISGENGKSGGFVVLSLVTEKGETKLKVLDHHCSEANSAILLQLICKQAARFKVDEIELPSSFEEKAKLLPFASVVVKQEQRRYLCHPSSPESPLAEAIGSLTLDLSDGDCAFT